MNCDITYILFHFSGWFSLSIVPKFLAVCSAQHNNEGLRERCDSENLDPRGALFRTTKHRGLSRGMVSILQVS